MLIPKIVLLILGATCMQTAIVLGEISLSGDADRDDYNVYRQALIVLSPNDLGPSSWLVADSTVSLGIYSGFGERFRKNSDLDSTMAREYDRKNQVRCALDSLTLATYGLLFFRFDEYSKSVGSLFWTRFREDFPNFRGFVRLSRVGFNADRTLALLFCESSCGSLCAEGQLMIFRLVEGNWQLLIRRVLWVS